MRDEPKTRQEKARRLFPPSASAGEGQVADPPGGSDPEEECRGRTGAGFRESRGRRRSIQRALWYEARTEMNPEPTERKGLCPGDRWDSVASNLGRNESHPDPFQVQWCCEMTHTGSGTGSSTPARGERKQCRAVLKAPQENRVWGVRLQERDENRWVWEAGPETGTDTANWGSCNRRDDSRDKVNEYGAAGGAF